MGRSRRVTLRCVCEDLPAGWSDPENLTNAKLLRELAQKSVIGDVPHSAVRRQLRLLPPLSRLAHPLILAFDDQFAGDDDRGTLRETVSSVNDRQWFKQTYSARWRGAAVILEDETEQIAWLGAAGYHRQGSPEDFYEEFARRCRSGSDGFLPKAEDLELRRIDQKVARQEAWKLQLHLTTLVLLDAAVKDPESTYHTAVKRPDDHELLTLSATVVLTDVRGAIARELVIDLVPVGWESPSLCQQAAIIVKSAIDPQFESWTSAPLDNNAESHWTLLTEESVAAAHAAATTGTISGDARPGEVRLGTIAHYSHRDHITYASVEGEAIQAMCGHWFVPLADHTTKPKCATCDEEYANTPA